MRPTHLSSKGPGFRACDIAPNSEQCSSWGGSSLGLVIVRIYLKVHGVYQPDSWFRHVTGAIINKYVR